MFEQLFKNMQLSAIGAKVVDDTKDFTVPVYVAPPPPPEEGKAVITKVEAPSTFTPNVPFNIVVHIRNDGGEDSIFAGLSNRDTGNPIKDEDRYMSDGETWKWTISLMLSQKTDFHGRVEAGHKT